MVVKYFMNYKLYTLVDITNTGQYRADAGKEQARWKEQNFNTVLQTIGLRATISYLNKPIVIEMKGSIVGFNTDDIIRLWRFDFSVDRDQLFENDGDPIAFLKDDFNLIPYINGLDELMEQQYSVFVTRGNNKNIVFFKKQ
jgi:hypothetical protein